MQMLHEVDAPVQPRAYEVLLSKGFPNEAYPLLMRDKEAGDFRWHTNASACLRMLGHLDEAKESAKEAVRLNETSEKAWYNLALIMEDFGEFEKCCEAIKAAYSIAPYDKNIAYRYATMHMRMGSWPAARDAWDYGREQTTWMPLGGIRQWYGEDLHGKNLLVIHEGGYGDFFWLMRYFKILNDMGCTPVMLAWKKQKKFIERYCPWIPHVMCAPEFLDEGMFHYQMPLWQLLQFHDGPMPMDHEVTVKVKEPLPSRTGSRPRVGICWDATEPNVVRKWRSIPVAMIEYLREIPVDWYALGLVEYCPDWINRDLVVDGWENVPSAIAQCDMVASVDTGIAHLAGSMGKKTVLMLPLNSSWQWGTHENLIVKKWYPSMDVIRNNHPNSWNYTISHLMETPQ